MLNTVAKYFDLQSESRLHQIRTTGQSSTGGHAPVLPQYLAVSAGILVEPFLRQYMAQGTISFDLTSVLMRTGFALVIGIILLPAVYKASFDPQKPIAVQIAALFPMGIGWQSLVATATSGALK